MLFVVIATRLGDNQFLLFDYREAGKADVGWARVRIPILQFNSQRKEASMLVTLPYRSTTLS
jgi:hypothetical protein